VRVGIDRLDDAAEHLAVGPILPLALLVLHHTALALEHLGRQVAGQPSHPVGLEVEGALEAGDGHVLEEVGAIGRSRAVAVVDPQVVHRLAEAVRVVLGAVEEEVLEQVGEPGPAAALVARADVVPDIDRHDRHAVVLVHQQGEAVVEDELLVRDAQILEIDRRLGGGNVGEQGGGQKKERTGDARWVRQVSAHGWASSGWQQELAVSPAGRRGLGVTSGTFGVSVGFRNGRGSEWPNAAAESGVVAAWRRGRPALESRG
jgi:hypothetical protein